MYMNNLKGVIEYIHSPIVIKRGTDKRLQKKNISPSFFVFDYYYHYYFLCDKISRVSITDLIRLYSFYTFYTMLSKHTLQQQQQSNILPPQFCCCKGVILTFSISQASGSNVCM